VWRHYTAQQFFLFQLSYLLLLCKKSVTPIVIILKSGKIPPPVLGIKAGLATQFFAVV
jgi:hypothetical protein